MSRLILNPRNSMQRLQGRAGGVITTQRQITGSLPPPSQEITFGGITLALAGIPGNAGTITVTGLCDTDTECAIRVIAIDWAGPDIDETVLVKWADTSGPNLIAGEIANAMATISGILAIATLGVVDFNLDGAGTIDVVQGSMREDTSPDNLLSNGNFEAGETGWAGWGVGGVWEWQAAHAHRNAISGTGNTLVNDFAVQSGVNYYWEYNMTMRTQGSISLGIGGVNTAFENSAGIYSGELTTTNTNPVTINNQGTTVVDIDEVILRLV